MSSIEERLSSVRARIRDAEIAAGRPANSVQLVAVSKTHAASAIREAYATGQRDFGESYAQELEDKAAELADLEGLRWHFIGHLQTNKAKVVARVAHVVHAIDSAALAHELGKRARAADRVIDALVEVNTGGELAKHGASLDGADAVLAAIEAEPALRLTGLMTMPPDDEEATKRAFDALVSLRSALGGARRLPELSMGMSDDLELGVARGATMVRVGTAIFGPRGA